MDSPAVGLSVLSRNFLHKTFVPEQETGNASQMCHSVYWTVDWLMTSYLRLSLHRLFASTRANSTSLPAGGGGVT